MSGEARGPLAGFRVLSLAEQFPGPFATLLLGDLGAEIIQVERPGGDPARAFPGFYRAVNRGRLSVALDLRSEENRQVLLDLAARSDAALDGFRPGVLDRLGVGFDRLRARNPALVCVAISGYGATSPHRDRPGHDIAYQAASGLLHDGEPALPLADLTSGLFAAIAVIAGLLQRERGRPAPIAEVAMVDALLTLNLLRLVPALNGWPGLVLDEPGYGLFKTRDGALVALAVAHEDHFWRRLCAVLGLEEFGDLGHGERCARRETLRAAITSRLALVQRDDLAARLDAASVPWAPVEDAVSALGSAHVAARGMVVTTPDGARHVRQPILFDGDGGGPRRGTPEYGQDTDAIRRSTGAGG